MLVAITKILVQLLIFVTVVEYQSTKDWDLGYQPTLFLKKAISQ